LAIIAGGFCNYFYGSGFSTTTIAFITPLLTLSVGLVAKLGKTWEVIPFGSKFVSGQVMLAAFLVLLAVMIIAAVATAASTRFGQMMTLMICTAVLGLGVISDYAFGQYEATSLAASIAYRVVPNIGPFWVIDGLTSGSEQTTIPWSYIGYVSAYAMLITTGVLSIAVAAFQRREVG